VALTCIPSFRSPAGKAVNPLLYVVFRHKTNVAPDLRDMKSYFLNEKHEVMGNTSLSLQKDKKGNLGLEGDTIRIGGGKVGFGS